MRVTAAHEEPLRQWNKGCGSRSRLPRLDNDGITERNLNAHSRGPGKNQFLRGPPLFSKRMVGRILHQDTTEIGFRSKEVRRNTVIHSVVTAACRLQIIIASVAAVTESRFAHTDWLRK